MPHHKWNGRASFLIFLGLVFAIGLGASLIFSFYTPAYAATQATLYASPTGSGSTCSLAVPCSYQCTGKGTHHQ